MTRNAYDYCYEVKADTLDYIKMAGLVDECKNKNALAIMLCVEKIEGYIVDKNKYHHEEAVRCLEGNDDLLKEACLTEERYEWSEEWSAEVRDATIRQYLFQNGISQFAAGYLAGKKGIDIY